MGMDTPGVQKSQLLIGRLCDERNRAIALLRELLDDYIEENGGDMPTSDGHSAHAARDFLDSLAKPADNAGEEG